MSKTISVDSEAATYCPPEILCPYPESIGKDEQELLTILNRHNFNYVLSGRIVREADKVRANVTVTENNGSIVYQTSSPRLEARVAALVQSEPGAMYRGDSND